MINFSYCFYVVLTYFEIRLALLINNLPLKRQHSFNAFMGKFIKKNIRQQGPPILGEIFLYTTEVQCSSDW